MHPFKCHLLKNNFRLFVQVNFFFIFMVSSAWRLSHYQSIILWRCYLSLNCCLFPSSNFAENPRKFPGIFLRIFRWKCGQLFRGIFVIHSVNYHFLSKRMQWKKDLVRAVHNRSETQRHLLEQKRNLIIKWRSPEKFSKRILLFHSPKIP